LAANLLVCVSGAVAQEHQPSGSPQGNRYDPALAQAGQAAFNSYCTQCHDAQRALQKTKVLAEWRATVRRMVEENGADIPQNVREAIATYLAAPRDAGKGSEGGAAPPSPPQAGPSPAGKEPSGPAKATGYDPALVQTGQAAFNNYCTQCHDAQRALQKTKSLAGWRATVRRMVEKNGADIPQGVHEAIATYLASRSDVGKTGEGGGSAAAEEAPSSGLTATIAPGWRGGGSSFLQNPGFFGDVWVGAAWQSKGPVSARATACISCHNEPPYLSRLELVEATAQFDVTKWLASRCGSQHDRLPKTTIEAGRFVVPFGAFYQQVNPGVYRTVTKPLIYNMGQRVRNADLGDPVLPMPYSDEGAVIDVSLPILDSLTAKFDTYVVNGLQGGLNGIDFLVSRDYVDNNREPAVGGRLAVGGKHLRLGGSVMGGRFNPTGGDGFLNQGMNYMVYGGDAVFHWEDRLRIQFEYARRDSDRLGFIPDPAIFREHVGGCYFEGEVLLSRCWHLSLVARYDEQTRRSLFPPPISGLPTGDFTVRRFTYGLNWTLPGGSLLMIDHEQWLLPGGLPHVDVVGVRWAVTF
jgi:cytochrome c553